MIVFRQLNISNIMSTKKDHSEKYTLLQSIQSGGVAENDVITAFFQNEIS